jgi:predicted DNA-binding protein (MmcQ/YjbR family)
VNVKRATTALRTYALGFPESWEDHPWGEWVAKVGKKVFVFINTDDDGNVRVGMKLPASSGHALGFPFAQPTPYGLGKSGWVTSTFARGDDVPVDLLREWIDESYRAIAPKRAIAQLDV